MDWSTFFDIEKIAEYWWIVALVVVAGVAALVYVLATRGKKTAERPRWAVRDLAIAALCIALSFVLSYIRIVPLPQGGSLTPASMLPMMMFGYIYGLKKGFVAGIAYGFLQLIQDPWLVNFVQVLLDYIFAFMALALAGMFPRAEFSLGSRGTRVNTINAGIAVAAVLRYICHVLSGVVFFAEYAGDMNPWVYSLGYNTFVLVEGALCIVIMLIPQLRKFVTTQRLAVRKK